MADTGFVYPFQDFILGNSYARLRLVKVKFISFQRLPVSEIVNQMFLLPDDLKKISFTTYQR
ncbi:MAG: hypothetical protein LC100_13525 [Chitinophagales bacterium]|nr:hypothetical protein [Chitinophagales bacterium]